MIVFDNRNVPQTLTAPQEGERVEQALVGLFGMEVDPADFYKRSREEFASLALVEIECVDLVSSMEREKLLRVKELITYYLSPSYNGELSPRDRLLLGAVEKWVEREYVAAHADFTALLEQYPTDALALFACHMLEFNMGWTAKMRQTIERVLPAWSADDALYGYVKGIEAFCLEENGLFAEAHAAAAEALRLNKRDIYAIHAVCHYFYETGQYQRGIEWMEEMAPDWQDNLMMRIHVWWHYALFHFYKLDFAKVAEVYYTQIRRKNQPTGLEDLDAVSMLWRLQLVGADAGIDGNDVLRCWEPYLENSYYWFNDLHAMLAYFANGEHETGCSLIERSINEHCDEHFRSILAAPFDGLRLFSAGHYREAVAAFAAFLQTRTAFGGSNAQRDVLEMTAIEAALRANEPDMAKALIEGGRCLRYDSPLRSYYLSRLNQVLVNH